MRKIKVLFVFILLCFSSIGYNQNTLEYKKISQSFYCDFYDDIYFFSYYMGIELNEHLYRYFIYLNTTFEGISFDTVDIANYYNGIMYGTMYGVTYLYYLKNIIYAKKRFHNMDQDDVVDFMYFSNYNTFITYCSASFLYLYVFYCFRFTKRAFNLDYFYCCDELNLKRSYEYTSLNSCAHDQVILCVKKRFEKRYKKLIIDNPYYKNGFINRYYRYYNESKFIDKELMRPDI